MVSYNLSKKADKDLSSLYEYGIINYGLDKADQYYNGLMKRFKDIAENPYLYRTADEIGKEYRLSVCGKHSIYYQIQDDTVLIVRILQRQDPIYNL